MAAAIVPCHQVPPLMPPEWKLAESATLVSWLSPKANIGYCFFSLSPTLIKTRYQKIRNLFFKRHIKSIQLSVLPFCLLFTAQLQLQMSIKKNLWQTSVNYVFDTNDKLSLVKSKWSILMVQVRLYVLGWLTRLIRMMI